MIATTRSLRRLVALCRVRALRRSLLVVMLVSAVGCSEDLFMMDLFRMQGTLNGDAVNVPAAALLVRRANVPDSLFLHGELSAAYLELKIEYSGPGTYALTRDNTQIVLLLGGDVRTGHYHGAVPRAGDLIITGDAGAGGVVEAQFWFDADHAANEQRFGPAVAFRDGIMNARVQVYQWP